MSNDYIQGDAVTFRSLPDLLVVLFLGLVVLASGSDLIADLNEGVSALHFAQETFILTLAVSALLWLAFDRQQHKRRVQMLLAEMDEAKHLPQPDPEVVVARRKLAEIIARQFQQWGLTQSEQEVGQLLLKGFSLKEISALRGTAEKTIRQQASSIYNKSGVSGRHAFSAWFIEDFL